MTENTATKVTDKVRTAPGRLFRMPGHQHAVVAFHRALDARARSNPPRRQSAIEDIYEARAGGAGLLRKNLAAVLSAFRLPYRAQVRMLLWHLLRLFTRQNAPARFCLPTKTRPRAFVYPPKRTYVLLFTR